MSRLYVLAIPIASACAYAPGSFSSPTSSFPGARTTAGCLDIAAALTSTTPEHGRVVSYTIGNRCDSVAVVDFAAVRARVDGVALAPFDPRHELRPLRMEARTVITEQIEYRRIDPNQGLCIDVGHIDGSASGERWLCQDTRGAPGLVGAATSIGGAP